MKSLGINKNQLIESINNKKSFLCVGLDTDIDLIPKEFLDLKNPQYKFNKKIIDKTSKYTVAYKINTAFYEANGLQGHKCMMKTVSYLKTNYPEILIIADAKRGDIGNTCNQYAKAFFEKMNFDAITLAPYMGMDSISPFLKYKDKWSIVLALTSNNSASDFELINDEKKTPLYFRVMKKVTEESKGNENIMFVVGATKPKELKKIRENHPDIFLLIPGFGRQGGTLDEIAEASISDKKVNILVNSSRNILYGSENFSKFDIVAGYICKSISSDMKKYF